MPETVFKHILTHANDHAFAPCGLPEPTDAIPGTVEKIAILSARLEAGVALHHPDDHGFYQQGALMQNALEGDDFSVSEGAKTEHTVCEHCCGQLA